MSVVQVAFAWDCELAENFAANHLMKTDPSGIHMDHLNGIVWGIHFEIHPL